MRAEFPRGRRIAAIAAAVSVAGAAIGERSFYALVEYPLSGARPSDLDWVSETQVYRGVWAPLVAGVVAYVVIVATVSLRRRLKQWRSVAVGAAAFFGWCIITVAVRGMSRNGDDPLYLSTIGKSPPTTTTGVIAIALAATALIVAAIAATGSPRAPAAGAE